VVTTVTVIPTTSDPSEGNTGISEGNDGDGKLGTGAIAGIAVGVVGAVAIAAGAAAFWFFKRRKRNQDDDYQDDPSVRGSSSGQVGSANPEMAMAGGSQASPNSNSNRNSTLQIDPRMDPFQQGLYIRPTGSHESINTLRDDHDYSRRIQQPKVLRATNPDANPDD
jgi:cell wall integrity and stress response component